MAQSQLSTINSTLAASMSLGVAEDALVADTTAAQTLTFVSVASAIKASYPVSQVLGISDAAVVAADRPLTANSTLSFSSLLTRVQTAQASSTLAISQLPEEFNYVADRNPVEQILGLTQYVQVQGALLVSQDLGISQTVSVTYPYHAVINHFLGLGHHTSTPYHMWVEDVIGFETLAVVPIPLIVSHTLNLVQDSPIGRVNSVIVFAQSAAHAKAYRASSIISMANIVDLHGLWVRDASHADILKHSLTYYEDTPCARKQYSPFGGETTTDSLAPPQNLQAGQGSLLDRFSLYQPALGSRSLEVILRAPELDNKDRNAYTRVQGETRGGKLRVYADPVWPNVRTLAVTIIGLTESEVDDLQTFMASTLGQEIGVTDWEGRLWSGTIVNPDEGATQDGKGAWTVSLEIEVSELTHYSAGETGDGDGQSVVFSQAVGVEVV